MKKYVTISEQDFENLQKKEYLPENHFKLFIFYGGKDKYTYEFISEDEDLNTKLQTYISDELSGYKFNLDWEYRFKIGELEKIKSKWWYKLFNKL